MTQRTNSLAGLIGAALIATAAPLGAQAASDEAATVHDFLVGTLQIEVPQAGWRAQRWLAADHTYRETGTDGDVRGTWSIANGKICTVLEMPSFDPARAPRYCNEGVGRHAGETWKDFDPITGNDVVFTLKPGR